MKNNVNEYKMLAVDALSGSHEDYLSIHEYAEIIINLCNEVEKLRAVRVEPKRTEIDPSQIRMVSGDRQRASNFSAKEIEKFWLWANDNVMTPEEALFHFAQNIVEHPGALSNTYEQGVEDGRQDGYDDGHIDGYDEGLEEGHDNGMKEGLEEGREEGHDEGHDDGYAEGYDSGFEDGKQEALDSIPPSIEVECSECRYIWEEEIIF